MDIDISIELKKTLLKLVRVTIADKLNIKLDYTFEDLDLSAEILQKKCGAFVTLHKKGNLRGCTGYIVAYKSIIETIQNMSLAAAFSDHRFPPLESAEYSDIDVEISLLSPIEKVSSLDEIEIGRDGLIISYGVSRGLLLPQVATENNWNLEQFLSYTCLKAGIAADSWKNSDTEIEKFSAEVFSEKEFG